jgi:hypothetical protein
MGGDSICEGMSVDGSDAAGDASIDSIRMSAVRSMGALQNLAESPSVPAPATIDPMPVQTHAADQVVSKKAKSARHPLS